LNRRGARVTGATPRGQRRARRVLAAARLSWRAMRFGLYYIDSINCLKIAGRTRILAAEHGALHWTNRFYRMADAADSAPLRAPPYLGRLRDVHTNSDGGEGLQTHKLLNYTTGRTYVSGSATRRVCARTLARSLAQPLRCPEHGSENGQAPPDEMRDSGRYNSPRGACAALLLLNESGVGKREWRAPFCTLSPV